MNDGLVTRLYSNLYNEYNSNSVVQYYEKNTNLLQNIVMKDSYYCARCVPIYFDMLCISNKNIGNEIYFKVKNGHELCRTILKDIEGGNGGNGSNGGNGGSSNNKCINNLFIVNFINNWIEENLEIVRETYQHILNKYLINLTKKYKIFSNNIHELIFIKLVLYTAYTNETNFKIRDLVYQMMYRFDNNMNYTSLNNIMDDRVTIDEKDIWRRLFLRKK